MALAPQAERLKRILTTHPPSPCSPLIIAVFEEWKSEGRGRWLGGGQDARDAPLPRQTQRTGTNAWHSVATDLPAATLATIDSEGSVRGEASLTSSKHNNALHTVKHTLKMSAAYHKAKNKVNNLFDNLLYHPILPVNLIKNTHL